MLHLKKINRIVLIIKLFLIFTLLLLTDSFLSAAYDCEFFNKGLNIYLFHPQLSHFSQYLSVWDVFSRPCGLEKTSFSP